MLRSPLLTIAEIGRLLRVKPRWLHARIASGELLAIRGVGRGYRVRCEWLEAFLAAHKVVPAAAPDVLSRAAIRRGPPPREREQRTIRTVAEARAALGIGKERES